MKNVPKASAFTPAPLRNRIRVELKAAVSDVWALIGDLSKFPEYSFGLERVEPKLDADGRCTEYVCYFKPVAEMDGERIVSREAIRWWEPNRGYASSSAQGDAFGLTDDLHRVVIEPSPEGATVTCEEYYHAGDLEMMKAHFDHALGDMGENLVRRFGGRIVERYVQGDEVRDRASA